MPSPRYRNRLFRPRPRRHGHAHRGEGFALCRPKLEMRSRRNGDADSRIERGDFLAAIQFAPYFSAARQHEPDFVDIAVANGFGCATWREFEVRHAPAPGAQQHANIRTVGRDDIRPLWQSPGFEILHGFPLSAMTSSGIVTKFAGPRSITGAAATSRSRRLARPGPCVRNEPTYCGARRLP
jgi:hypothetical protein